MTVKIISDDTYLAMGISSLFKCYTNKRYCFVDVDRIYNYHSVMEYINSTSRAYVIVLILRGGVNSQPLMRHGGISIHEPIGNWKALLKLQNRSSRDYWLHWISIYMTGQHLTKRQKYMKNVFKTTLSINEVAEELNLSEKTIWVYLDQMYKQYNFSRLRDYMGFIRRN